MGWVIVEFSETREVFMDDKSQGPNRDANGTLVTLIVGDGLHTFRLAGDHVDPPSQTVDVKDTAILDPLRVVFTKKV